MVLTHQRRGRFCTTIALKQLLSVYLDQVYIYKYSKCMPLLQYLLQQHNIVIVSSLPSQILVHVHVICMYSTSNGQTRRECICDIFGYHIWLQSDAAFVYPRLDKYSLSVGMFWSTCCLSRSPLGRLATASSLAGNVS